MTKPYTDADVDLAHRAFDAAWAAHRETHPERACGAAELAEEECCDRAGLAAALDALFAAGRMLPGERAVTIEYDIDWIDLRAANPTARAQAKSYAWKPDEAERLLAKEVEAADRFHRAPVRIRKRTVSAFADGSKLVAGWMEVPA